MSAFLSLIGRLFSLRAPQESAQVTLRAIRPDDADALQRFVRGLSPTSRRQRFHAPVNELSETTLRALTCVDQREHVAFVLTLSERGTERIVGEARYAVDGGSQTAEFGIVLDEAFRGVGLADRLVTALIAAARTAGLRWLVGDVLASNSHMLAFVRRCGFVVTTRGVEPGVVRVERSVDRSVPGPQRAGYEAGLSAAAI
jgi:acetyltransferase